MMARTKRGRCSYSVGEWGRNRVRVFPDPKTGPLQIEWRENGRRLSQSLKPRVCAQRSPATTISTMPSAGRRSPTAPKTS